MSTNNNYKGFPLFNEEENFMLQSWNRFNTLLSINERHGEDDANVYLAHLGDRGKKAMAIMAQWVAGEGHDAVAQRVLKEVK